LSSWDLAPKMSGTFILKIAYDEENLPLTIGG
jgi:hypothetical protein